MLAILQPLHGDLADTEQRQFPALDELLGSMHMPCSQASGRLQPAISCFALELEQDIAALEAEATRCVDVMNWEGPAGEDVFGSCATGLGKAYSIDLDSCGRDQAVSESESDEEWELPATDEVPATVPAVARIARRRGKPVKHGAWQGCCKSAWCDREDRHRGLCNHKATVPGPTVSSPQSEDACSTDHQEAECCAHPAQQELSSGGHSHNCSKSQEAADSDEREVASAFKSDFGIQQSPSMQEASLPFSCLPQLQLQPQQQLPPTPNQQQPAVWDGSDSQLAAAEQEAQEQQLFAMPAMYQPRVKDLEAADISSMLSGEEGLCSLDTEATTIAVPVVEPVEMETATVETSSHTALKHALSTPSSPSCVSAAARTESGAFSRPTVTLLLPATLAPAAAVVAVPSACMRGMLALEQVHPTINSTAAAKRAAPGPAAGPSADAAPALKRAKLATSEALLRRCSSSGSSCASDASAAAAALAAAAPSPASVFKAAANSTHKPAAAKACVPPKAPKPAAGIAAAAGAGAPAGAAVGAAAAAAAAADAQLPPPMARAQRIKQRPRRPDDPPRPLLDLSNSSSPSKISICSKKRPAARMAPAPTTGHSCSQCGATSTPVWRAGPAGPKTLCNACGVRYMKTSKRK